MSDIDKLIFETNKSFGKPVIDYAHKMHIDVGRISSGSLFLDWALGGGFPLGRIVEIYGPYSSGKTLIAMKTITSAQKIGLPCVFIDAELSFEKKAALLAGIDLEKLVLMQSGRGEKIFDFVRKTMEAQESGVIVIDSVAAIVPDYEDENETEKQTMGLVARLMSKGLRVVNNANRNWLIIFVNQVREKIGIIYGNPETTPGGRALGFFAGIRLHVKTGDKFMEDQVRIGHEIKFKVEKSKVGIPFREGSIKYMYETGIDQLDDVLSLAMMIGVIQHGGAWYTVYDERYQGRASIEEKCRTDEKFFKRLFDTVTEELKKK